MRRRIFWMIIVGVPLALITVAAGTAAALPAVRHIVSGLWNLPDHLPSVAENSQQATIRTYTPFGKNSHRPAPTENDP
jgi:hypothetical protein